MNKIRTHKIYEQFDGMPFSLFHLTEKYTKNSYSIDFSQFDNIHRDDYYIFVLVEKGMVKLAIDFEEYEISENNILCILPSQVHSVLEYNACSWLLIVDKLLVKDEDEDIFKKYATKKNKLELSNDEFKELNTLISLINKRINTKKQAITNDLISVYISIIADAYQKEFPISALNRFTTITSQFELLLSKNYITLKRPADYAKKLNISVSYLNECINNTTGLSVSYHIQQHIVLEAKRLLFHSNKSVKEIAAELGYKDYAYFSRMFSKVTGITASAFRKNNCD